VLSVYIYIQTIPNKIKAEARELTRKYFIEASKDVLER